MKKRLTVILALAFLFSAGTAPIRAAPAAAAIKDVLAAIDGNKLVTVSGALSTGPGQVVAVRILDPKGNVDYAGSTVTTSLGSFNFAYTMKNTAAGTYTVTLNALGLTSPVTTVFQYGTNNGLKDLTVSSGGLDKAFSPAVTEYAVTVDSRVTSITVTPTANDSTAGVSVNETAVTSGAPSAPLPLQEGANSVKVKVTALSGESKTYTITVTRPKTLSALLDVKASVNAAKTVAITGIASSGGGRQVSVMVTDPRGGIDYLGNTTSTGNGSFQCSYTMPRTVTGRYTVLLGALGMAPPAVTYFDYVQGAELKNLVLSSGSLNPAFQSSVTSYTAAVNSSTDSITVTPTAGEGSGKILVNEINVPSGQASAPITLYPGETTINIDVLTQDGTIGKTYALTVTRPFELPAAVSLNAEIDKNKLVTVNGMIGSPAEQYISVLITDPNGLPEYVNSIKSTAGGAFHFAYTMRNTAKGRYNVTIGAASLTQPLRTYFIYNPGCADLKELSIENEVITPLFAPNQTEYSATVKSSAVKLTAAAEDSGASIQINNLEAAKGSVSRNVNLNTGDNKIEVAVTATDGTIKTYTIHIYRLIPPTGGGGHKGGGGDTPPALSSDADLSGLTVSPGTFIDPDQFPVGDITYYVVLVDAGTSSVTVTPTASDPKASITVNGDSVLSGHASEAIDLTGEITAVTIVVTAEDGTEKTYTVGVRLEEAPPVLSSDADLSGLTVSPGTFIDPDHFPEGDITYYVVSVEADTSSVTVTPTASDPNASITVNDDSVLSGHASEAIDLTDEITAITIVVTAEDGTEKTYTVGVRRV